MQADFERKMVMREIGRTTNLPIPSEHAIRTMSLLRDDNVNVAELIENLSRDQSLVAQILKLVNSGFYGLRHSVESMGHAVTLLGIKTIKLVVYSATVMEMFTNKEQAEWNHSYSTSVLMSNLIKSNSLPVAANLAVTTLMHDIGKVVLRRYSPKKYSLAVETAVKDRTPTHQLERKFFHIDHAEVGGWLLKQWDMSEDIYLPIMAHHEMTAPEKFLVETILLRFVDHIDCRARGYESFAPSCELMRMAGFEEVDFEEWVETQKQLVGELDGVVAPVVSDDSTKRIRRPFPGGIIDNELKKGLDDEATPR